MLLSRRGQLNAWELEDALAQLAIALDHFEQMCILHRDVKPQNLLCSPEPYKLADFGDALVLPVPMDSAVCLAGSPKYWPPEGAKVLDFRRDIYALGLTVVERTQHLDLACVCLSMMQPLETRPHARDVQIMLHQTRVPAEWPLKKMRRAIPTLYGPACAHSPGTPPVQETKLGPTNGPDQTQPQTDQPPIGPDRTRPAAPIGPSSLGPSRGPDQTQPRNRVRTSSLSKTSPTDLVRLCDVIY